MTKRKKTSADHIAEIRTDREDDIASEYDVYTMRASRKILDFSGIEAVLNFYTADRSTWTGYFEGDNLHAYKVVANRKSKKLTVFPIGNLDHL